MTGTGVQANAILKTNNTHYRGQHNCKSIDNITKCNYQNTCNDLLKYCLCKSFCSVDLSLTSSYITLHHHFISGVIWHIEVTPSKPCPTHAHSQPCEVNANWLTPIDAVWTKDVLFGSSSTWHSYKVIIPQKIQFYGGNKRFKLKHFPVTRHRCDRTHCNTAKNAHLGRTHKQIKNQGTGPFEGSSANGKSNINFEQYDTWKISLHHLYINGVTQSVGVVIFVLQRLLAPRTDRPPLPTCR
jgi:hypothetical protein